MKDCPKCRCQVCMCGFEVGSPLRAARMRVLKPVLMAAAMAETDARVPPPLREIHDSLTSQAARLHVKTRARYARVLTRAAAFVRAVDTGWGGWDSADVVRNNVPPVLWALIADLPHEGTLMLRGELVSYRAFSHWKREHPRAIRAAIIQAWPHAYGRTLRDEMYRLEMERNWAQAENRKTQLTPMGRFSTART